MKPIQWKAYGDVNPLQHGGLWIALDPVIKDSYIVVEVVPPDEHAETDGNGKYLVSFFALDFDDVTDGWITDRMESILSYAGMEGKAIEEIPRDEIIRDILSYFGRDEFQPSKKLLSTEKEVIQDLKEFGIEAE